MKGMGTGEDAIVKVLSTEKGMRSATTRYSLNTTHPPHSFSTSREALPSASSYPPEGNSRGSHTALPSHSSFSARSSVLFQERSHPLYFLENDGEEEQEDEEVESPLEGAVGHERRPRRPTQTIAPSTASISSWDVVETSLAPPCHVSPTPSVAPPADKDVFTETEAKQEGSEKGEEHPSSMKEKKAVRVLQIPSSASSSFSSRASSTLSTTMASTRIPPSLRHLPRGTAGFARPTPREPRTGGSSASSLLPQQWSVHLLLEQMHPSMQDSTRSGSFSSQNTSSRGGLWKYCLEGDAPAVLEENRLRSGSGLSSLLPQTKAEEEEGEPAATRLWTRHGSVSDRPSSHEALSSPEGHERDHTVNPEKENVRRPSRIVMRNVEGPPLLRSTMEVKTADHKEKKRRRSSNAQEQRLRDADREERYEVWKRNLVQRRGSHPSAGSSSRLEDGQEEGKKKLQPHEEHKRSDQRIGSKSAPPSHGREEEKEPGVTCGASTNAVYYHQGLWRTAAAVYTQGSIQPENPDDPKSISHEEKSKRRRQNGEPSRRSSQKKTSDKMGSMTAVTYPLYEDTTTMKPFSSSSPSSHPVQDSSSSSPSHRHHRYSTKGKSGDALPAFSSSFSFSSSSSSDSFRTMSSHAEERKAEPQERLGHFSTLESSSPTETGCSTASFTHGPAEPSEDSYTAVFPSTAVITHHEEQEEKKPKERKVKGKWEIKRSKEEIKGDAVTSMKDDLSLVASLHQHTNEDQRHEEEGVEASPPSRDEFDGVSNPLSRGRLPSGSSSVFPPPPSLSNDSTKEPRSQSASRSLSARAIDGARGGPTTTTTPTPIVERETPVVRHSTHEIHQGAAAVEEEERERYAEGVSTPLHPHGPQDSIPFSSSSAHRLSSFTSSAYAYPVVHLPASYPFPSTSSASFYAPSEGEMEGKDKAVEELHRDSPPPPEVATVEKENQRTSVTSSVLHPTPVPPRTKSKVSFTAITHESRGGQGRGSKGGRARGRGLVPPTSLRRSGQTAPSCTAASKGASLLLYLPSPPRKTTTRRRPATNTMNGTPKNGPTRTTARMEGMAPRTQRTPSGKGVAGSRGISPSPSLGSKGSTSYTISRCTSSGSGSMKSRCAPLLPSRLGQHKGKRVAGGTTHTSPNATPVVHHRTSSRPSSSPSISTTSRRSSPYARGSSKSTSRCTPSRSAAGSRRPPRSFPSTSLSKRPPFSLSFSPEPSSASRSPSSGDVSPFFYLLSSSSASSLGEGSSSVVPSGPSTSFSYSPSSFFSVVPTSKRNDETERSRTEKKGGAQKGGRTPATTGKPTKPTSILYQRTSRGTARQQPASQKDGPEERFAWNSHSQCEALASHPHTAQPPPEEQKSVQEGSSELPLNVQAPEQERKRGKESVGLVTPEKKGRKGVTWAKRESGAPPSWERETASLPPSSYHSTPTTTPTTLTASPTSPFPSVPAPWKTYVERRELLEEWKQKRQFVQEEIRWVETRIRNVQRLTKALRCAMAEDAAQKRRRAQLLRELAAEKARRRRLLRILCQSQKYMHEYQTERAAQLENEVTFCTNKLHACIFTNKIESSFANGQLRARVGLRKLIHALQKEAEEKTKEIARVRMERRALKASRPTQHSSARWGDTRRSSRNVRFADVLPVRTTAEGVTQPPSVSRRGELREDEGGGNITSFSDAVPRSSSRLESVSMSEKSSLGSPTAGGAGSRGKHMTGAGTTSYPGFSVSRSTVSPSINRTPSSPTARSPVPGGKEEETEANQKAMWFMGEELRRNDVQERELYQEISSARRRVEEKLDEIEMLSEQLHQRLRYEELCALALQRSSEGRSRPGRGSNKRDGRGSRGPEAGGEEADMDRYGVPHAVFPDRESLLDPRHPSTFASNIAYAAGQIAEPAPPKSPPEHPLGKWRRQAEQLYLSPSTPDTLQGEEKAYEPEMSILSLPGNRVSPSARPQHSHFSFGSGGSGRKVVTVLSPHEDDFHGSPFEYKDDSHPDAAENRGGATFLTEV